MYMQMAWGEASGSGSVVPQLVLVAMFGVLLSSSGVACPSECHCLDHDSIVNCHHAGVDRLPSPLPPPAIVVDADRNRISALHNSMFF